MRKTALARLPRCQASSVLLCYHDDGNTQTLSLGQGESVEKLTGRIFGPGSDTLGQFAWHCSCQEHCHHDGGNLYGHVIATDMMMMMMMMMMVMMMMPRMLLRMLQCPGTPFNVVDLVLQTCSQGSGEAASMNMFSGQALESMQICRCGYDSPKLVEVLLPLEKSLLC